MTNDYKSGYNQCLADVLEALNEVQREVDAAKGPHWADLKTPRVKLRELGLAVGWIRARIRGMGKERSL